VKDLFGQACERPAGERGSFLAEACGGDEELRREVSSLLESYRETGGVLEMPIAVGFGAELRLDPMVGRAIGAYKIIRRIGRGGMGSVYLAQRADDQFRRLAAIKAVNPDLVDAETLRRFHNERQTLAALDHPNIIKLLDGGASEDGAPYLVMDYVEGQPIDEYCNARKLSTAERLRLFRTVCAAVTYAHQNLVVHRDLKPSNILITPDGVPKLLDFGIAKLLKPEYAATVAVTRGDLQPMTPRFASPEQVLGQPITTVSDIYSLGVLLYLLLTGSHPYQLKTQSALELERAVCEMTPEKPSASVMRAVEPGGFEERRENRARRLSGDLDMIVLMAMRKEPQRRYPSAEHLSEDIRRHLDGLPVMACRDSWRYRWSKFAARHKAGVAAGIAIAAALSSSTVIALRQRNAAEMRFEDLRQFADFTLNDLDDALRLGVTPARKKLVGKALEYLDGLARESRSNVAIQRDLIHGYIKMGDVQGNLYGANLGESSGAEQSYRKALAIAESLAGNRPEDAEAQNELASANFKLADVLGLTGNGPEALQEYGKARQIWEALRARDPSDRMCLRNLTRVWDRIGFTQDQMRDQVGALQSYRRSLEVGRAWFAVDPKARGAVAMEGQRVAYLSAISGETDGAEETIQEAIRLYQSSATAEPSAGARRNIAKAYKTVAEVQKRIGKLPQALDSVRKSLGITEDLLEKDPRNRQFQLDFHQALVLLIDVLHKSGNNREARLQTVRALGFLKPLVTERDALEPQVEDYVWLLVTTPFPDLEDNPAALRYARKVVALTRAKDPQTLDVLARAYAKNSDFANAAAVERKAVALLPPFDPTHGAPELRKMLEANVTRFEAKMQTGVDTP
jgi:non-specific serine/threonine protein kinase/serine/threonine-protein kinase